MLDKIGAKIDVRLVWFLAFIAIVLLRIGYSIFGWIFFVISIGASIYFKLISEKEEISFSLSKKTELIYLLAIIVMAAFLRIWDLHSIPPGCWFDEAENGLETSRILQGDWFFFTPANNGRGALQFFWTAPFFYFFGANIYSLRLATAIVGLLTIPAAWILFRKLAGAGVGLIAGAFIAFSSWHFTISRIGFDAVLTPLFDILVIYCVISAVQSGYWRYFILSGLLAGIANYGYAASRLTPLFLIGGYLCYIKSEYWSSKHWRGLLLALMFMVVTLLPLAYYGLKHSDKFIERGSQVNIIQDVIISKSPGPILRNLRATFRMFHERGDVNARHNLPGTPMLDPIMGLMLVFGLIFSLENRNHIPYILMFGWLCLVLLLGGVLTRPAPHGLRTLSAIVPISFFSALGIRLFLDHFKLWGKKGIFIIITLLIISVLVSVKTYFIDYAKSPEVHSSFSPVAYEVGKYLRTESLGQNVYISDSINISVVRFVSGQENIKEFSLNNMENNYGSVYIVRDISEAPRFIKNKKYHKILMTGSYGEQYLILKLFEKN